MTPQAQPGTGVGNDGTPVSGVGPKPWEAEVYKTGAIDQKSVKGTMY